MHYLLSIEVAFGFVAVGTPVALIVALVKFSKSCIRSNDDIDPDTDD